MKKRGVQNKDRNKLEYVNDKDEGGGGDIDNKDVDKDTNDKKKDKDGNINETEKDKVMNEKDNDGDGIVNYENNDDVNDVGNHKTKKERIFFFSLMRLQYFLFLHTPYVMRK